MFFERVDYTKIQELSKKMKSFFCQGRTINTTSYMNWRISKDDGMSFWSLAEGYFETADALISKCLEDNSDKKADIFIFPILFNVVHAVELSLKAINDYLNIMLYDKAKIEGGHDIKQLSDVTLKLLQKFKAKENNNEVAESITAIKLVKKFIDNIFEKTNDMAFARYPINSKNEDMFYNATLQNVMVDMELLQEQIAYVATMLDFVFDYLCRYIEYIQEMKEYYE